MDIKTLKHFQHLASSLSFSKTADAMFVSPPTLTRSIMRLEQECKAVLFQRDNRNVQLTQAGRRLLVFTDETLAKYHQVKSEMVELTDELKGELSLYCSVTAAQTYLPTILDSMRARYPAIEIKLDTGDHDQALKRISDVQNDNVADLAIAIHTPNFPANIQFQAIDTVPLTLIVPVSMNINKIENISWHSSNVIMPSRGPSRRIVHHWFAEHNIRPKIYANVSGNEAIVSMVSLGFGIGFVPRIVLENSTAKNRVRSIAVDNIEPYQLGLCYLKSRANEPLLKTISQLFSR